MTDEARTTGGWEVDDSQNPTTVAPEEVGSTSVGDHVADGVGASLGGADAGGRSGGSGVGDEAGAGAAGGDAGPSSDAGGGGDAGATGDTRRADAQQMLSQLQGIIDNLRVQATPVVRDVAAKAAELAAVAAERAGPMAQKAAEKTQAVGERVATRGREVAAGLRQQQGGTEADAGPSATGEESGFVDPPDARQPAYPTGAASATPEGPLFVSGPEDGDRGRGGPSGPPAPESGS